MTLQPRASSVGCSYFGVRVVRHVRRDMADLAARGYTGVLHTFSENDLAYYRETFGEIVAASHEAGLTVQVSPWGLGRTFGGEAESRWVAFHPEECQVLDDGRRVAAACLNSPAYRAFCAGWAGAAIDAGVDYIFWDEPAWVVPRHVGVDDASRWTCRCAHCRERFGADIPRELTPEVRVFREASVLGFLREAVADVVERGGKNTICLLPSTEGAQGISDWDAVAALPGLSVFATDPYWKHWGEPAGAFVNRFARLLSETCGRHGVGAQLWVPSFGLTQGEIPDLEDAIRGARDAGIEDLWTWGYEACGHMSALATPDAPRVWAAVTEALTGAAPLEARTTRSLVGLVNAADDTVADAVAAAGDSLAEAIDAIVERLGRGGRLVYLGAGTSGRIAEVDASECSPTFGTPPGQVIAIAVDEFDAEDDAELGRRLVREAGVGRDDAVVAISASGSTPFTVAGFDEARGRGALGVAVVCAPRSALEAAADHAVVADVGPEIVSGSTRMKAGTAQKMIVNAISTVSMIRLGRTYAGLMVGVVQHNAKLRERARRNVVLASGAPEDAVDAALAASGGDARVALVALLAGVDAEDARRRLEGAGGSVGHALGSAR
ncbi:MAG: N-acetylmuramic acid 6-phosphate etherase [Acidobacteriota bacterium]|nr:N-acetylmuramic acid 6-phosphate etherase [Acidobacteriota bacterium]